MNILVYGINHTKADVNMREKLYLSKENHTDLQKLLLSYSYITEVVSLSTCNRTEVYVVTDSIEEAKKIILELLAKIKHLEMKSIESYFYAHVDEDAVQHLFRVTASLDSMVIGESQILGQVKDAYQLASSLRSTGPILTKLFSKSFHSAKRVRTETALGERPISVATCALSLAKKIFTNLDTKKALLIGLGDMGTEVALLLIKEKIGSLIAINRTYQKAQLLAQRLPVTPMKWEDRDVALGDADIVITCAQAEHFLISYDAMKKIVEKRKGSPLFLIDIAIPRNVDQRVSEIDSVFLYDLDSLNLVINENKKERGEAAEKAHKIITAEVQEFIAWREGLLIAPTIQKLRMRLEQIKEEEVARYLKNGSSQEVAQVTNTIFNKFLHIPISQIKESHSNKEYFYIEAIQKLFKLE